MPCASSGEAPRSSASVTRSRPRDVAGAKRVDGLIQRGLGFALPLGLRPARTFDVGPRAIVLAIEEQHARPEIDRVFVAVGEVFVEPGEQQLLDPRVAFDAAQRLCGTRVGTQRIH
jgi:hypothetical protein